MNCVLCYQSSLPCCSIKSILLSRTQCKSGWARCQHDNMEISSGSFGKCTSIVDHLSHLALNKKGVDSIDILEMKSSAQTGCHYTYVCVFVCVKYCCYITADF